MISAPEPARTATGSDQTRRSGWLALRRLVRILGWIGAAAGVLGIIVHFASTTSQPLIVLACAVPFCALTAILATALLASLRRWIDVGVSAVIALVLVITQAPQYLNSPRPSVASTRITMLSGNMRIGNANADQIVALARDNGVSVVALQELTFSAALRLKAAGLDAAFPYSIVAAGPNADGVGLWSRLPITDPRSYPGFNFHEVSAVINLDPSRPDGQVTFYSTHVSAPWPQPSAEWTLELPRLGALLAAQQGPVVDGGDFNATLDHSQFRQLLAICKCADAAQQSGSAPDMTYPADRALVPPLLAIDHVVTRVAVAHSVHTVRLFGSDHRGLITRIGLPPVHS